ncbi:MAG: TetR family transcriptional regulator [Pseudomonadota bacterium]
MAASNTIATGPRGQALTDAALRVIGRAGLDGVTHRAVAAEAGVSLGAVTHHFPTRDAIVDAALRSAVSREVGRLQALAFTLQHKAFDIGAWIDALVGWYASELRSNGETHIACYEAMLAAARSARHRAAVAELFNTWQASAELALRAAGSVAPRLHAELFVSALVGRLLQQLAVPSRHFRRDTTAALTTLVHALAGGAGRRR